MTSRLEPPLIVSLPKPPKTTSGSPEPDPSNESVSEAAPALCCFGSPVAEPPERLATKNASPPSASDAVTVSFPSPVFSEVVVRCPAWRAIWLIATVSSPEPVQ